MRRIMNDRMYDTDKATLVVKYREELEDEPLFGSSFLYLKKTYFGKNYVLVNNIHVSIITRYL